MRALDDALPGSVRDDILLLVTEPVTNAVRHGGVGPDRSLDVALERWSDGWGRMSSGTCVWFEIRLEA
jgi:hypothetical protein